MPQALAPTIISPAMPSQGSQKTSAAGNAAASRHEAKAHEAKAHEAHSRQADKHEARKSDSPTREPVKAAKDDSEVSRSPEKDNIKNGRKDSAQDSSNEYFATFNAALDGVTASFQEQPMAAAVSSQLQTPKVLGANSTIIEPLDGSDLSGAEGLPLAGDSPLLGGIAPMLQPQQGQLSTGIYVAGNLLSQNPASAHALLPQGEYSAMQNNVSGQLQPLSLQSFPPPQALEASQLAGQGMQPQAMGANSLSANNMSMASAVDGMLVKSQLSQALVAENALPMHSMNVKGQPVTQTALSSTLGLSAQMSTLEGTGEIKNSQPSLTFQLQQAFTAANSLRGGSSAGPFEANMSAQGNVAELLAASESEIPADTSQKPELVLPSVKAASTAMPIAGDKVQLHASVRVGMPGWADQIAQRTANLASQNIKQAEIQLNPLELGPINVKISMSGEQAAVTFAAQNALTREALDQSLNRLRDTFEAEGFDLVQADVSADSQRYGGNDDEADSRSEHPMATQDGREESDGEKIGSESILELSLTESGIDDFV